MTHIMKTTLDLDDDLLIEAKAVAARRRTTLKAMVEHALRRELQPAEPENPDPEKFEIGPLGLLVLKKRPDQKSVTTEDIRRIQEEIDEEDLQRALHPPCP